MKTIIALALLALVSSRLFLGAPSGHPVPVAVIPRSVLSAGMLGMSHLYSVDPATLVQYQEGSLLTEGGENLFSYTAVFNSTLQGLSFYRVAVEQENNEVPEFQSAPLVHPGYPFHHLLPREAQPSPSPSLHQGGTHLTGSTPSYLPSPAMLARQGRNSTQVE